jgi:hypothetical protein
MRFEKTMMFVGAECRPGFKDPSKMVYQVACLDGMDYFKPFVTPEIYDNASKRPIMSPVFVALDVNLTSGRVSLLDLADVAIGSPDTRAPADAPATADKSGKNSNNS